MIERQPKARENGMKTMNNKNIITRWGAFAILVQVQIGLGIFSLPNALQNTAKGDGWISVLFAGIITQILITAIWFTGKLHPNQTFIEYVPKLFGKIVGFIITITYIFYFVAVMTFVTVSFADILKRWVFIFTPTPILIISGVLLCTYLAVENLQIITRFISFSVLSILISIVVLIPALSLVDIRYILPVGNSGMLNILKSTYTVTTAMLGFEIFLLLLPSINSKSRKYNIFLIGNIVVTLVYSSIVLISLTIFSPNEIKIIGEPVLYMLKSFQFRLLERVDLIFLCLWTINVVSSFVLYLYSASFCLTKIMKKQDHKWSTIGISLFVILISIGFPRDPHSIKVFGDYLSKSSLLFVAGFPILFLLISIIKKLIKKENVKR